MAKTSAPTPSAPDVDPKEKFRQLPIFGKIINELDVNKDQLARRQKLIGDIEAALTKKYKKPNRMIVYMMRFGQLKINDPQRGHRRLGCHPQHCF